MELDRKEQTILLIDSTILTLRQLVYMYIDKTIDLKTLMDNSKHKVSFLRDNIANIPCDFKKEQAKAVLKKFEKIGPHN